MTMGKRVNKKPLEILYGAALAGGGGVGPPAVGPSPVLLEGEVAEPGVGLPELEGGEAVLLPVTLIASF